MKGLTMSKKDDTVKETKYVYTHLIKILVEKHGWDKYPLITKDSVVETQWEGQPVKHLKI
jgi:hypothetical protein